MLAREVMTREVLTLSPSETLREAALRLQVRGVSGAPVVDAEGRLVGVLSETDFLRYLKRLTDADLAGHYLSSPVHSLTLLAMLAESGHPAVRRVMEHLRTSRVSDAMTVKVLTAVPEDPIEKVVALMIRGNVNRIPILEGARIVGILTRGDILRIVSRR